jgi:hypothetical protein
LWLDDTNRLQAPEIKTVNVRLTVPCPRCPSSVSNIGTVGTPPGVWLSVWRPA